MKGLKEIYELLEDASAAIMIFEQAIITIEKEPFYELKAEDGKALFFIDEAYDLVKKYNIRDSVDLDEIEEAEDGSCIAMGWIKHTGEETEIMLEDLFFQLDKDNRLVATKKIIRKAEVVLSLSEINFKFITYACLCVSYGSKERYIEIKGKGKLSIDELLNLITSLVTVSAQLLSRLSINCIDFGIGNVKALAQEIFPNTYQTMNLNFFDTIPNIPTFLPIFSFDLLDKIYNKCNGKQWENITQKDFFNLLYSNGVNQSLTIKDKEINRTKYVFKTMANCIKDENRRKIWIENIKKSIFNDVDFMRATLRTNKLGSYSSIDAKFQEFFKDL